MDSLQSLLSSIVDSSNGVGDLTNKITRLEIDLEEEQLRNRHLEVDIKRLCDEIILIKSYRDGLVYSNEATDPNESQSIKALFHCGRFARAGGATFENLFRRA